MSRVVVAATLPVEQERLWGLLCDTRRYPEWVEMTTAEAAMGPLLQSATTPLTATPS